MAVASAPGKVILFGEHAVVYPGHIGIAAAIGKRAVVRAEKSKNGKCSISSELGYCEFGQDCFETAQLDSDWSTPHKKILAEIFEQHRYMPLKIEINSDVRPRSHLGSGSSVYAALSYAVLAELVGAAPDLQKVSELAYAGDVIAHGGKPSGIDSSAVTYGGLLKFTKSVGHGHDSFEFIKLNYDLELLICDSGEYSKTRKMIGLVESNLKENPGLHAELDDTYDLAIGGLEALRARNFGAAGRAMFANQKILAKLGVSTSKIDDIVQTAMGAGAYGAKLTGAGGGGCVVILADDYSGVEKALAAAGYNSFFKAKLGAEGVKLGE